MPVELESSLTLPCGAVLPNRLAKAAMTEGLADPAGHPTEALSRLYRIWSDGGAGLLLTGNVMLDADHLERPGNVVLDRPPDAAMAAALKAWAEAATANGNHCWVQLSHAGRQTLKTVNPRPKAPSAVPLGLPGGQFGRPEAMTVADIETVIERFGMAARAVQEAGFTGVQIHGAHGYLLSQFLSPRSNLREDEYGGSLENRARILLEAVRTVREAVGSAFPVSVKLNSADFQRGGFAFEESLQVARWLEEAGIDLLEISGGTYEQPRLLGIEGLEPVEQQKVAASTAAREAYFVDFARAMHERVAIPIMVTGGLRTRDAMLAALNDAGADVIGLGRPLCVEPDGPAQLLSGAGELVRSEDHLSLLPGWLRGLERIKLVRTLATFATQYWYYAQLDNLGRHGAIDSDLSVGAAAAMVMKQQRSWLKARPGPG